MPKKVSMLLLACAFACVDDENRCGERARLTKTALQTTCTTFAELDAAPKVPTDAAGDASTPSEAAASSRRGTWGDPCTRDEDCGEADPSGIITNRCGINANGDPFVNETAGACTKTGCDLEHQTGCPGNWTCIDPGALGFPGFPIACWCLEAGGTKDCTP